MYRIKKSNKKVSKAKKNNAKIYISKKEKKQKSLEKMCNLK